MQKNKKMNFTMNFSALYLINYMVFAFVGSQRKTFLIELGYTVDQIALIFAFIPVIQIILQLFIGYLSDKYNTVKKLMIVMTVLSAIVAYAFYSVQTQFFVFHFATGLLSQSISTSITELSDVWVLNSGSKTQNSYGFIRALGSLGWAVGSYLLAGIISAFGYDGLAMACLLLNVILLAIMASIYENNTAVDLDDAKEAAKLNDVIELFKDPYYLLAIMIVFFVNMANNMSSYILIDKVLLLGGSIYIIAIRNMVAAGVEIPLLILGNRILKKIGTMRMLIIGVFFYNIQFFGFYFSNTNNLLIMFTAFQFISLPFFNIAIKYLLLDMSPDHLKTTGQLTGPAIVNGFTSFIFPIISAFLMNRFSLNSPLLFAAVLSSLGLITAITLNRKYSSVKLSRKTDHLN